MVFFEKTERFGTVKTVIDADGVELERGYIYLNSLVPLHTHIDEKGRRYAEAYVLLSEDVDVRILILDEKEAKKITSEEDLIKYLDKQKPVPNGVAFICEPGEWHAMQCRSSSVPIIAYRKFYSL